MTGQEVIVKCREIIKEHQADKVDGVFVDATSAHAIVQVYDALSSKARDKLCEMMENEGVVKTTHFVWKLIAKTRQKAAS
jgi:hypothetical protein